MPGLIPEGLEVQVFAGEGGPRLVCAIELVSPANKDRPATRRAFAAKCASYLHEGIGLLIVDVVTSRSANLHNELIELLDQPAEFCQAGGTQLYATAYRQMRRGEQDSIEIWPSELRVGKALPELPLWLGPDLVVPVNLEATYRWCPPAPLPNSLNTSIIRIHAFASRHSPYLAGGSPDTRPERPAQRAKDARIVRTLLRLPGVDLADKPEAKAALLRYLAEQKGTDEYLQIAEKFSLRETKDELLRLAIEQADGTLGVKAAGLLVKFGEMDLLKKAIADPDPAKGAKVVVALGLRADAKTNDLLTPLVADSQQPLTIRAAAVTAIGRNSPGQKWLLATVEQGKLHADLKFAAANVLLSSADEAIKTAAGRHLSLPAGAGGEPLPPVAELVKRTGDATRGKELFAGIGTCQVPPSARRGQTSRRRPVGNRQQALARGDVCVDPRSQRRYQRRL